jgi:predicted  nucleic acid-binding Zn-ribbon protein
MDNRVAAAEKRIQHLTQKYAELQTLIEKSNNAQELEQKDAEIAQLKKDHAKLEYRIDFLVRELQNELKKNKE